MVSLICETVDIYVSPFFWLACWN